MWLYLRALHTCTVPHLIVIVLSLLLTACGNDSLPSPSQSDTTVLYRQAVLDAYMVTPAKVYQGLTHITPDNPNLIWEHGVVGGRVLVTTWMGNAGASYKCPPDGCQTGDTCKEGRECPTYRWDTWVTVAPELKNFFKGTVPTPLRVAQLLGLPPDYAMPGNPKEARYVLELWVSPADLFRPCPDPEITDRECQTDYPNSAFLSFTATEKVKATEGGVSEFRDYRGWFDNRSSFVYSYPYPATNISDPLPYPWTRLGYTYDWGDPSHIGLSEYVVHGNRIDQQGNPKTISVGIKSVKTTTEYFVQ
ncbi:hypothetical protein [Trichlorobacter ammonificans]|uniref:Lipoprotein n=1 Tax=Trichlorobacter ammonificans TaxID=2916410 RepID=A0ABM9D9X4_9BACT|nr:hypothetical protein [Trichlorobacter ammonificans]CAH2031159.1 conserved protein of unknown function [Trichlorobacter ammonificans]